MTTSIPARTADRPSHRPASARTQRAPATQPGADAAYRLALAVEREAARQGCTVAELAQRWRAQVEAAAAAASNTWTDAARES